MCTHVFIVYKFYRPHTTPHSTGNVARKSSYVWDDGYVPIIGGLCVFVNVLDRREGGGEKEKEKERERERTCVCVCV